MEMVSLIDCKIALSPKPRLDRGSLSCYVFVKTGLCAAANTTRNPKP